MTGGIQRRPRTGIFVRFNVRRETARSSAVLWGTADRSGDPLTTHWISSVGMLRS